MCQHLFSGADFCSIAVFGLGCVGGLGCTDWVRLQPSGVVHHDARWLSSCACFCSRPALTLCASLGCCAQQSANKVLGFKKKRVVIVCACVFVVSCVFACVVGCACVVLLARLVSREQLMSMSRASQPTSACLDLSVYTHIYIHVHMVVYSPIMIRPMYVYTCDKRLNC